MILFILLKIFSRSISEDECGTENSVSATGNCYCQSGEYDCITGIGLDGETCKATTTKGCGTGCTKCFSGETAKCAVCIEAGYFESGKTEGAAPISTGLCVCQLGFTLNGETCESSSDPSDSSTRGEYESFSPAYIPCTVVDYSIAIDGDCLACNSEGILCISCKGNYKPDSNGECAQNTDIPSSNS